MGLRRAGSGSSGVQTQRDHAAETACGSPECKSWCQQQNFSKDKQLFEAKRTHSWRHLEAVAQMHHRQADVHNSFLHEHSQGTESWKEPSIHGILSIFRRETVSTGSTTICVPQGKEYPAGKVTGLLTMSRCVADKLEKNPVRKPDTAKTPSSRGYHRRLESH